MIFECIGVIWNNFGTMLFIKVFVETTDGLKNCQLIGGIIQGQFWHNFDSNSIIKCGHKFAQQKEEKKKKDKTTRFTKHQLMKCIFIIEG